MPTANNSFRALTNRLEGLNMQAFRTANPYAPLGGPRGQTDSSTLTQAVNGLGLFYINGVTQDVVPVPAPPTPPSTFIYLVGGRDTVSNNGAISRWNGETWSAPITVFTGGVVRALAYSGTTLVAGGNDPSGGVISTKVDGGSWSTPPTLVFPGVAVVALAYSGTTLVAGANDLCGGLISTKVDGGSWSIPLLLFPGGGVQALAYSGTTLVAGGNDLSDGVISTKVDGGSWSTPPTAVFPGGVVVALAYSGTTLAAGGNDPSGGVISTKVDGGSWSTPVTISAFDIYTIATS